MKILIIEDDKDISWIWQEGFKSKNHTIKAALDGEEGLKLAKS